MSDAPTSEETAIAPVEKELPGLAGEVSLPELVRRLHAGEVRVESLHPEVRQLCVEHLTHDGFSSAEIAALLRVTERTVRRDRAAVRQSLAVAPSTKLAGEWLGEFQRFTLGSIQRLIRLARDPVTPPYARLWAEESISRIHQRLVATAHRIGFFVSDAPAGAAEPKEDPDDGAKLLFDLLSGRIRREPDNPQEFEWNPDYTGPDARKPGDPPTWRTGESDHQ